MNAVISSRPVTDLGEVQKYAIRDAVKTCSRQGIKYYGEESAKRRVVLWDFGAKENIVRELVRRDNYVIRVSSDTTAEEILALRPDGVMLTNGPGDPEENPEIIRGTSKSWRARIPVFGICLGAPAVSRSPWAAKRAKMKYGHRGANQPVKRAEQRAGCISPARTTATRCLSIHTVKNGRIELYQRQRQYLRGRRATTR